MVDSDIKQVISDLIASGYSEQQIADALKTDGVEVHQSTIHRIKRGELRPRFDVGMGILRLHERAREQRAAT